MPTNAERVQIAFEKQFRALKLICEQPLTDVGASQMAAMAAATLAESVAIINAQADAEVITALKRIKRWHAS